MAPSNASASPGASGRAPVRGKCAVRFVGRNSARWFDDVSRMHQRSGCAISGNEDMQKVTSHMNRHRTYLDGREAC